MASVEQVEAVLVELIRRADGIDPSTRAMLPSRRVVEARCPDLDLVYHARWSGGQLGEVVAGPADRPDIRISVDSDDLVAMSAGELAFHRAYASGRIRLDASMTDLLRLRAVL